MVDSTTLGWWLCGTEDTKVNESWIVNQYFTWIPLC